MKGKIWVASLSSLKVESAIGFEGFVTGCNPFAAVQGFDGEAIRIPASRGQFLAPPEICDMSLADSRRHKAPARQRSWLVCRGPAALLLIFPSSLGSN